LVARLLLQVALQFPDRLLADSVLVANELRRLTSSRVFILGDTTYGRYAALLRDMEVRIDFIGPKSLPSHACILDAKFPNRLQLLRRHGGCRAR
jgi:aspartate carbamoyltransferase catalytic subunit